MVLTSNIAPSGWDEFFTGDDTLLCALEVTHNFFRKLTTVSVNIFFTIFTNVFSPIAPTRMRRIRQRGCAAFGV